MREQWYLLYCFQVLFSIRLKIKNVCTLGRPPIGFLFPTPWNCPNTSRQVILTRVQRVLVGQLFLDFGNHLERVQQLYWFFFLRGVETPLSFNVKTVQQPFCRFLFVWSFFEVLVRFLAVLIFKAFIRVQRRYFLFYFVQYYRFAFTRFRTHDLVHFATSSTAELLLHFYNSNAFLP